MRILVLTESVCWEGLFYTFMRHLLEEQRRLNDLDIRVVGFESRPVWPVCYLPRYRPRGIVVPIDDKQTPDWMLRIPVPALPAEFGLGWRCHGWSKRVLRAMPNRWEQWKPDIVHAHWIYPSGRVAQDVAEHYLCPFVVTEHGKSVHAMQFRKSYASEVPEIASRADSISCVGESLKISLIERGRIDTSNIRVIYNGINHRDIDLAKEMPPPTDLPLGKRLIVSIGKLVAAKGHYITIEAIASISSAYPNVHLIIIGPGPDYRRLKDFAKRHGVADKVTILGAKPFVEAMRYLHQAEVFCLPSWNEGFGLVYLEALYAGKPIIGVRGQGVYRLIEQWQAGILTQPKRIDSVAEALCSLLSNPQDAIQMAQRGQVHARLFTWQHAAQEYRKWYLHVLDNGRASGILPLHSTTREYSG